MYNFYHINHLYFLLSAFLRIHFSKDSTITASSPTCVAADSTQFTSLTPLCTATVDAATGDTFVDVADLVAGKQYYVVSISGILNAKSAKIVQDTKCESSSSSAFTSIIDTGTVPRE